jgi:hypothetical protein
MESSQTDLLKRQSQELDFGLWIESKGDWPLVDMFSARTEQRTIGWLMGVLWLGTSGSRCQFWGDLMPDSLCEMLNLPRGGDGMTYSYALRLIRRNLNWLAHLAG